jgi:hypothetical protein
MAQQVLVKNVGSETYREVFRENEIVIPAGGTVKMQRREALLFLGTMSPTGSNGRPIEKKLELVPVGSIDSSVGQEPTKEFICNLDGKKFGSQAELDAHLKTLSSKTVTRDQIDSAARKREG